MRTTDLEMPRRSLETNARCKKSLQHWSCSWQNAGGDGSCDWSVMGSTVSTCLTFTRSQIHGFEGELTPRYVVFRTNFKDHNWPWYYSSAEPVFINLLCFRTGKEWSNNELFVMDAAIFVLGFVGHLVVVFSSLFCVFPYPLPTLQHWFLGYTLNLEHIYSDD